MNGAAAQAGAAAPTTAANAATIAINVDRSVRAIAVLLCGVRPSSRRAAESSRRAVAAQRCRRRIRAARFFRRSPTDNARRFPENQFAAQSAFHESSRRQIVKADLAQVARVLLNPAAGGALRPPQIGGRGLACPVLQVSKVNSDNGKGDCQ
jgi:hypothetical protein